MNDIEYEEMSKDEGVSDKRIHRCGHLMKNSVMPLLALVVTIVFSILSHKTSQALMAIQHQNSELYNSLEAVTHALLSSIEESALVRESIQNQSLQVSKSSAEANQLILRSLDLFAKATEQLLNQSISLSTVIRDLNEHTDESNSVSSRMMTYLSSAQQTNIITGGNASTTDPFVCSTTFVTYDTDQTHMAFSLKFSLSGSEWVNSTTRESHSFQSWHGDYTAKAFFNDTHATLALEGAVHGWFVVSYKEIAKRGYIVSFQDFHQYECCVLDEDWFRGAGSG
jgi:hypothetical protein